MQRMESNLPQDGVLHGMQIAPLGLLYPTPVHHVGYFLNGADQQFVEFFQFTICLCMVRCCFYSSDR